jgi:NifU-like domain
VDETTITPALDELRGLVQADGADMTLTGVDGTTVNLQLVVETASCVECVMPRELLEQMALNIFRRNGAGADAVVIDDPREHPDFVMPGH